MWSKALGGTGPWTEIDRSQSKDACLTDLCTYSPTHTAGRARFYRTMAPPAAVPPPSSTLAAAAAPASTTSVALAASVGNGNGNGNGSHDGATPPAVLKQPFIATRLNNFLHLPYVYDLSWCVRGLYTCVRIGVWRVTIWPSRMAWTNGSVGAAIDAALAYCVSAPVTPHRPPAPQKV